MCPTNAAEEIVLANPSWVTKPLNRLFRPATRPTLFVSLPALLDLTTPILPPPIGGDNADSGGEVSIATIVPFP